MFRSWKSNDNIIHSWAEIVRMFPNNLSQSPSNPISGFCIANPFADREPYSRKRQLVLMNHEYERTSSKSAARVLNSQELFPFTQARVVHEFDHRRRRYRLTNQFNSYLEPIETVSRLRPFARRRLMTSCPDSVAMRLRKPCLRLRRKLEGWYVRFIAYSILFYEKFFLTKELLLSF